MSSAATDVSISEKTACMMSQQAAEGSPPQSWNDGDTENCSNVIEYECKVKEDEVKDKYQFC